MRAYLKLVGSLMAACAVCACVSSGLYAQGFGSVNGTVTDSSGAVVAGAKVTLTQAGTGISQDTTTSGGGTFVFPTLDPSVYNVVTTHAGFQAYKENDVQVRADAAVTVNVTLKPGNTS